MGLLNAVPGTFTWTATNNGSCCNRFHTNSAITITGIQIAHRTGDAWPTYFYLWVVDNSSENSHAIPPNSPWIDRGNGVWALPLVDLGYADFPVAAGKDVNVSLYFEGSNQYVGLHAAPEPTEDPAVEFTHRQYQGIPNKNPFNSAVDGTYYGIDIEGYVGTGGPPIPGVDPADTTFGELAIWLQHGNPELRPDSLPKLIYDYLGTMQVSIDGVATAVGNIPGLPAALTQAYLTNLSATIDQVLTEVDNLQSHIVGASGGGGSAFFSGDGRQVAETVAEIQDALAIGPASPLMREWLTLSPDLTDPLRWTNVGTTTGTGDGVVTDGADLYLVTITAIPPAQPQMAQANGDVWVPRMAWCSPQRNGASTWRQYLDFGANYVHDQAIYMGGLLINTGPGVSWSVDAMQLDRP